MGEKRFLYQLEALRGVVALLVVLHHIIMYQSYFNKGYKAYEYELFLQVGHLGVLIFFVLSGYVIGLGRKLESKGDISHYLKRRFLRLYPIYFLSVILALVVSPVQYDFQTIINNLSFTGTYFHNILKENKPVWSLHYEVLFYILFIPISYFRINSLLIFISSLVLGILSYKFSPALSSYAVGFSFWAGGLFMARNFKEVKDNISYTYLLSLLMFLFAYGKYNILPVIFNKVSYAIMGTSPKAVGYWAQIINHIEDIALLPYCMLFVIKFAEIKFPFEKYITAILMIIPVFTINYIFKNLNNQSVLMVFIVPTIFYLLSLLLLVVKVEKMAKGVLNLFTKVGSISYGIYIIHFPLLPLFQRIDIFTGSLFTFYLRLIVFFSLTILLAYLLEKKFQPVITKRVLL